MSGLNVSGVVNVQIILSPIAAATRNFGSLLILGASSVIDTVERLRLFSGLEEVGNAFGTTSEEYKAATAYFSQSPQPSQVYVGRWAKTATSAVLHGAILTTAQQALANFTAVSSGGMRITIDGTLRSLSAINLSAVTNLNGVASAVTTALAGAGTCTWDATLARFDITSSTTGATSTITVAQAPVSGTDISALMGLQTGQASAPVAGIAAESLVSAINTLLDMSSSWYGLYVAATAVADADIVAAAGVIEAASMSRVFGATTQNTAALNPASTTDLPSLLKAAGYKRTFCQYSSKNAHAAAGIFGRAFTVDFDGSNTTLTLKFKTEPGIEAEELTASQAAALKAKNCNVYVKYNNDTAIIQEGVMANGYFFDEVHGTDWLQNDVQTAVFNLLYGSTTKIPQTDAGVSQILSTIASRLTQAVRNGLLAPGQWDADGFGALSRGDFLSTGFYVYAPPVATQSQASRAAREAPTIQCAAKLAGAVHFANILINANR